MRGLETMMRRSPDTEGVIEHSLYRTRGGAYVAVFARGQELPLAGSPDVFQAMFLNKGSSAIPVSPGTWLRYRPDGSYRFDFAGSQELDLAERVGYEA